MATTFVDYTGDGNATKAFSFPSYKVEDIKVEVDEVLKTSGNHYNITSYTTTGGGNVVFTSGNEPNSPSRIRIFRDTDVDNPKATYEAGSSVKADDLNNNNKQLLYSAQEEQNQTIQTHKIKDSAVTSAKIKDGTIVNADVNASAAIEGSKIQASSGSVAGTMSSANFTKLAGIETGATADQTDAEIRAAVEAASDSNVFTDADHSKLNGIESGATADQTNAEIRTAVEAATDSNVFTDADHSKLNGIEAGATADQTITEIKSLIAGSPLDASHLAANSVTTTEIADAELSTLAGMQSGTASILADSTALTATTAELNQLDGITLETTLTSSDTRIPTSKAVNDQILAVTNALGGFVAIDNETSFPTSNPDPSNGAGTVVSISQVSSGSAVSINSSGVATISNGAGTGNTVTITGFPTTLRNTNLAASSGLQVQTTTTLHTYTFHKQLASASDIAAISATVNSFSNRYRVSSSAPPDSLDGGDLWYDTTNSKLMVYSSQNSAWEEATAIGNFFISTISSSSNTGGGSATANGTAYRFTISDAPTSAQQLLVSVDGVIQKPNSGTSQPSEGFALSGHDIIFGSAPVNGASIFVTVLGSTVGIGTPSDNTVTSAILQNGSVIESKLGTGAVTQAKIADDAVGADQLASDSVVSASIVDGSIVNADINASAAIAGTKISPDFGSQYITTTGQIQIGGTLPILAFVDSDNNPDYEIKNANGNLNIRNTPSSSNAMQFLSDGHIDVNANTDFASGIDVTGNITVSGTVDGRDVATDGTKLDGIAANAIDGSALNASNLSSGTIPDARFPSTLPAVSGANLTGITSVGGANGVTFNDNVTARFGTGNDVSVKHDGYSNLQIAFSDASTSVSDQVPPGIRILNNSNTDNGLTGLYFASGGGQANVGIFAKQKDAATSSGGQGCDMWFYTKRNGQSIMAERARFTNYGHFIPATNSTYDLGDSSYRWRNVYTNDLHLSNKGHTNDVDGTWGDWTIQEGESDLFLKNNRSGKKYKFNLTEVS